jgi:exodeoxyribonuclease VII large subunit
VAACPIPIVSAVGHEVDFTICDFVADVRAPTPSGAAEIVVPNQRDWRHRIGTLALRIGRIGERAVEDRAQELDWLGKRLVASSPAATLQRQNDSLRENRARLTASMRRRILELQNDSQALRGELMQLSPALAVQRSIGRLAEMKQRLAAGSHEVLSDLTHHLALLGRALHSVSPLATLDRGYAIVKDAQGKVLTEAAGTKSGDEIRARLSKGELVANVTKVVEE